MDVLWFRFCLHLIGKKNSLVAKNRLCGYCVDGGGNWRSIIPVHVLPIQSSPVQSYFIRCLNDHRIMFKSFACDWSNWSDEKRVKNSNILNRKFIFGQRKLQTHELHCQDKTTAFFRVGEREANSTNSEEIWQGECDIFREIIGYFHAIEKSR